MSWHKSSPNYAESASNIIRLCVAADRQSGKKTLASLHQQALAYPMPPRRVRRLFEMDRAPFVGFTEYARLLLLCARYLRRTADRLRECADRWDAEADLMELNRRQLTLWNGDGAWEFSGNAGEQKRAAA